MIHVDVCTAKEHAADYPAILVQTSTDGAGWKTQYIIHIQLAEISEFGPERARELAQERAKDCARIFANGCRYAGAEVRTTAFGYGL